MPNIKSAEKRATVTIVKRARNMSERSALRTAVKKMDQALATDAAAAANLAPGTMKALDQAASKGIIHKNKAARKKAQMMKKLSAAQ